MKHADGGQLDTGARGSSQVWGLERLAPTSWDVGDCWWERAMWGKADTEVTENMSSSISRQVFSLGWASRKFSDSVGGGEMPLLSPWPSLPVAFRRAGTATHQLTPLVRAQVNLPQGPESGRAGPTLLVCPPPSLLAPCSRWESWPCPSPDTEPGRVGPASRLGNTVELTPLMEA